MNFDIPPLTWLYVPADRPDRYGKAVTSGADAVIIDLEDAVAAGRKQEARSAAARFLAEPQPLPVFVRVNDLTGPDCAADLEAVAGLPGLTGLRLPKVRNAGQVRSLAAAINRLTDQNCQLHCLIESADGLEDAFGIATADSAVCGIGLGEADLAADLNVYDTHGLIWARSRIVVAARAADLPPPAMSAYTHVSDLNGLAESCRHGRRLGFFGRTAIHPRQLPVIVEAFQPSPAEVDKAQELLEAFAAAQRRGSGTAVLPDGRFADVAMVAAAARTVALAERNS